MKRIINKKVIACLIFLTAVFLSGCNNDVEKENEGKEECFKNTHEVEYEVTSRYLSPGLDEIIAGNPIDEKYESREFEGNHKEYNTITEVYTESWYDEMNYAIEKLLPLLDEDDRKVFLESQKSWESYYQQNLAIQTSLYKEYKYEPIGQDYWMAVMDENARKIRDRALEVIEYLYAISGEYTFSYDSEL